MTVGSAEETVSCQEEVLEEDSGEPPVLLEKEPVPPGSYFRLGEEGGFRQYENQYSLVQHALSRNQVSNSHALLISYSHAHSLLLSSTCSHAPSLQVLDDATKRTRLSHKFSLTEASTFSWQGREVGTRAVLVATIRASILALEQVSHDTLTSS